MPADPETMTRWLLAGARLSALLAVMPVPGFGWLGAPARIWFGFTWAYAVLPLVPGGAAAPLVPGNTPDLVIALIREVILGLMMGWLLGLSLSVYRQTASLIGLQTGFALAQAFAGDGAGEAGAGEAVNPLDRLYQLAAGAVILASNAHHQAIIALVEWLRLVPPGMDPVAAPARLAQVLGGVLGLALRLGLPVIGGLLAVDLALMILVRTAPQLNLFGVGLPVKLGLGLVLIALSAPLVFGQAPAVINGIIQAAGAVFGGSRGAF